MVSRQVPSQPIHFVKKVPILERKLSIAVGAVGTSAAKAIKFIEFFLLS